MTAYEETLKDLVSKLKELFQMDQADLDFGIYRVMKAKHDEIDKFLTKDLLPTVKKTLEATGKSQNKQKELDEIISNLRNAGIDPDTSPKVQELKALLENGGSNSENDAKDIFSNLITFFSRYYSGGDFMSLRRYKKDTYSPLSMNGEEVKLHWANADQYYIKSSENLTNYAFVDDPDSTNPLNVKFVLVAATTEQNNNKSQEGERVFTLASESPFEYLSDKHELSIKFEYQVDAKKRKQKDINANIVKHIEKLTDLSEFPQWPEIQSCLLSLRATKANPKRTLIEKHLIDFTAKNKFDYFIHKDLGGFLNKELDYFIKSELVKLDDIIPSAPTELNDLGLLLEKQILTNESQLKKVIALKSIAQKIIQFLAQLESFQKKLWLKKKFVLDTNYCITLDKIPHDEELFNLLISDKQLDEWVSLFAINKEKVKSDFENMSIVEFVSISNYKYLSIDTKHLSISTKFSLINHFDGIDDQCDFLLINSDNFHALNLMEERFKNSIDLVYVDPPYNTENDRAKGKFLYKDGFDYSTWLTFIQNRLPITTKLMNEKSVFCSSIGNDELARLKSLLDYNFNENLLSNAIWLSGRTAAAHFTNSHEYVLTYAKNLEILPLFKYSGGSQKIVDRTIKKPGVKNPPSEIDFPAGIEFECEDKVFPNEFGDKEPVKITKGNLIAENGKLKESVTISAAWTMRDMIISWLSGNEVFDSKGQKLTRFFFKSNGILQYEKEKGTVHPNSVIRDITTKQGTLELENKFGAASLFDFPKPSELINYFARPITSSNSTVLDFFAGSGSTGEAIINLNREDLGKRKCILIEMGNYFSSLTKPRVLKSLYSKEWKKGEPTNYNTGMSAIVKYQDLESYEDVLSNIDLTPTNEQKDLLGGLEASNFSEQYTLQYMIDIESKEQLFNNKIFDSPLIAEISVVRNNKRIKQKIDLVETFNYLRGLNVSSVRELKGVVEVVGTTNSGDKCLILWRDILEIDSNQLDEWFKKQDYNSRDMEFDLIYVNGDNNLPNLKTGTDHWKVQLIETEFYKLMFDVNEL